MISRGINFYRLERVDLELAKDFQTKGGLYLVIDSKEKIQYIGQQIPPHIYEALKALGQVRVGHLRLDTLETPSTVEKELLDWYSPPMNT